MAVTQAREQSAHSVLSPRSSVVVVGTVGLDTVETPFDRVEEVLGGSAIYFAAAAALYTSVHLVAVVGEDLPAEARAFLQERRVDLAGLQTGEGRTFRWSGRYHYDLNSRDTVETQLNVLNDFRPWLPESYRAAQYLFLANIDPELQLEVLSQVVRPRLTVLDSMNYWITGKRDALTEAIGRADVVLMNEEELRQYCDSYSVLRCARQLLEMGPRAVIVKRGPYGAALIGADERFVVPSYPVEEVRDPTGAGDSFAGGFLGYLTQSGDLSPSGLRRAVVHGSVVASYAVEDFSIRRLAALAYDEVAARYREFRQLTYFEEGG